MFNYDILEANIVASELRKIGYELICFFVGYDNNDITIIKITDIDRMKERKENNCQNNIEETTLVEFKEKFFTKLLKAIARFLHINN